MREIKFRGKSKNVNEWCYGTYIFTDDNRNNPFRTGPFKESHRIVFWCSGDWNMGGWVDEEVIPETIGQYTGLKDKNGKEIYEGDIMNDPTSKNVGVVTWNSVLCQFQLSWQNMHVAADIFFMVKCNSFVIGNIYDNPELIKRKEK